MQYLVGQVSRTCVVRNVTLNEPCLTRRNLWFNLTATYLKKNWHCGMQKHTYVIWQPYNDQTLLHSVKTTGRDFKENYYFMIISNTSSDQNRNHLTSTSKQPSWFPWKHTPWLISKRSLTSWMDKGISVINTSVNDSNAIYMYNVTELGWKLRW